MEDEIYNGPAKRDYANEFDKDDAWIISKARQIGRTAYAATQIVKSSIDESPVPAALANADAALTQVTDYIAKLRKSIFELEVRLNDAHEEIAEYIDLIDEKNEKIDGQAKYIEILERQIKIAEKYIVREYK